MNKYIKYSLLGLTLILNIFWAYFIVNARLGSDWLTAETWDVLTAAKWNAMLQKTSDWRFAKSSNYVNPGMANARTDIPWLTQTIDLPRDAKVIVNTAWSTNTPSSYTHVSYRVVFDWVWGGSVVYSMWNLSASNWWTNWSLNDGTNLTAWTHTITIQVNPWSSWAAPAVCWNAANQTWLCSMNILAFY